MGMDELQRGGCTSGRSSGSFYCWRARAEVSMTIEAQRLLKDRKSWIIKSISMPQHFTCRLCEERADGIS